MTEPLRKAPPPGKPSPAPPSRFGHRAIRADQPGILRRALEQAARSRGIAAFDLDSTVLNNRPRQARLVREYGEAHRDPRLASCGPSAIVSWDLRETLAICGLPAEEIAAVYPDLKRFWGERFFTSEYCKDDEPVAGAGRFLELLAGAGARIVYLTGRHQEMGAGTIASFRRAGFPVPDADRVQLWLKPTFAAPDDEWKNEALAKLRGLGEVAAAFDNEPTHVNAYKLAFPAAQVVHLDTDHSERPVPVLESIPSIVDFVLEPG